MVRASKDVALRRRGVACNRNVAFLPCQMSHGTVREYLWGRNGPGAQRGLGAVQSVRTFWTGNEGNYAAMANQAE